MNSFFYLIFIFVGGFAVFYSFKQLSRKSAYKFDPRLEIRELIANEIGLTMTSSAQDAFSQQFVISGKDANLFNKFLQVETIKQNLLEAHYKTGGLIVRVKNGRILYDETGFSFQNTRTKLSHTTQLINTLCHIAKAVETLT